MTITTNKKPAKVHQQYLHVQTALTVLPHRLMQNEREYVIAPCIMIVQGVLNGGYVSGDDIQACQWDGIPVVIGHPMNATGAPVSANSPDVLAAYGVGRVFRTRYSTLIRQGHSLVRAHAEIWLDVAQVRALGGEAEQALTILETQNPLEVSTAFYCESEPTVGSFLGVPFAEVHRNLQADHLALLPNGVGACSWSVEGCGAPRLNAQAPCACDTCTERSPMEISPQNGWQAFVAMLKQFVQREDVPPVTVHPEQEPESEPVPTLVTAATDVDTRDSLYGALAREASVDFTPIFIESIDTTTQSFTYRQGERLRQRSWQMDGEVLQLVDDAQDVQRSTTYVPVTSPPVTQQQQEVPPPMTTPQSSPVAIKARVNALITNAQSGWTERDRAMLEGMSEAALIRLEAQPTHVPAIVVPAPEPPKTMEEAIALLPVQLQETMSEAAEDMRNRKQAAIAVLIANTGCPFEQDELAEMSVKKLEKLVAMAAGVSYAGKGLPAPRHVPESQEAPPPAPDTLGKVVERQKNIGMR